MVETRLVSAILARRVVLMRAEPPFLKRVGRVGRVRPIIAARRLFPWVALVVGVAGAVGAPSFANPVRVHHNSGAIGTVAADLNGDGRAEFVTAATKESSGAHLRIHTRLPGAQGFTNHTLLGSAALATRQDRFGGDLAIGDVNRDGFADIIVPESDNGDGAGRVSWFENPQGNLSGVWTEHVISVWTGAPGDSVAHMSEVAVGDIDGDGWPDVVTRDVSHGCFLLLQNGTGTGWHPRRFIPTNPREGLALWDPDGDGDLDILLNGVWLETPPNPLVDPFTLRTIAAAWYPGGNGGAAINDYACKVATGDFNGDGRPDVLISNAEELENAPSTETKPKGIRLYLSPADVVAGVWQEVALHTNHFSWHTLALADLEGDGDLDVVSGITSVGVDNAPPEIVAFLNDGTGTVFVPQTIASGVDALFLDQYCYSAALGDADGDGDADLFAPDNWNSGPLRYFENLSGTGATNAPTTPAQLTAIPLSTSRAELNWIPQSANHSGFVIERRDAEGEEFDFVGQAAVAETKFVDAGLAPESAYVYRIRAFNGFGESDHSGEAWVATPPDAFYTWQVGNFGDDPEPAVADDAQDPDGDAVPNVLEYFLGTDPNVAGATVPVNVTANGRVRLHFTRDPGALDVSVTVQAASSPVGPWTDLARSAGGAAFVPLLPAAEVSETPDGPLRQVSVSDLYLISDPLRPVRLLRLRLER